MILTQRTDACEYGREKSRRQQVFLDHTMETDQLIYYFCLPWMDMTAMTNERDLAAPEARDESIPHIAWGKYMVRGDRLELGISIEVNHRLIDGITLESLRRRWTGESVGWQRRIEQAGT